LIHLVDFLIYSNYIIEGLLFCLFKVYYYYIYYSLNGYEIDYIKLGKSLGLINSLLDNASVLKIKLSDTEKANYLLY
jgi:hypothetical protein